MAQEDAEHREEQRVHGASRDHGPHQALEHRPHPARPLLGGMHFLERDAAVLFLADPMRPVSFVIGTAPRRIGIDLPVHRRRRALDRARHGPDAGAEQAAHQDEGREPAAVEERRAGDRPGEHERDRPALDLLGEDGRTRDEREDRHDHLQAQHPSEDAADLLGGGALEAGHEPREHRRDGREHQAEDRAP